MYNLEILEKQVALNPETTSSSEVVHIHLESSGLVGKEDLFEREYVPQGFDKETYKCALFWHDYIEHLILISSIESIIEGPSSPGIANMIGQNNVLAEAITIAITKITEFQSFKEHNTWMKTYLIEDLCIPILANSLYEEPHPPIALLFKHKPALRDIFSEENIEKISDEISTRMNRLAQHLKDLEPIRSVITDAAEIDDFTFLKRIYAFTKPIKLGSPLYEGNRKLFSTLMNLNPYELMDKGIFGMAIFSSWMNINSSYKSEL